MRCLFVIGLVLMAMVAFAADQDAERNQAANAQACSNAKRAKRIGEATVRAAITFQTKHNGKRAILAAEEAMLETCDFKVGDFESSQP